MNNKYRSIFDRLYPKLMGVEGGYANHPSDLGKETIYGVTAKVARLHGYSGPIKDMPKEIAYTIAKKEFWDVMMLDYVALHSEHVAYEMLDTGYNMGPGYAVKFLQASINSLHNIGEDLEVDGVMGPKTLQKYYGYLAVRGMTGESILLKSLNCLQGARYIELSNKNHKLRDFVNGWFINRVTIQEMSEIST